MITRLSTGSGKQPLAYKALAASLAAWLVLGGGAHGQTQTQTPLRLTLLTEHSPPASMLEDGKVVGFSTDKVREIMQRAGIDYTLELLPWKRAYTAALEQTNTCVFSTTRTPEREKLFKWVGPTDEAEWVLMGRAGQGLNLRTLDDARALRIGTYNGDARDAFLRTRGFQVDPAPNDLINPRKLLARRIDLWAAVVRRDGSADLKRWGEQIVPLLVFNRVRVYLACNPGVADSLIERMNVAADAIQHDGSARRIQRKYEPAERARVGN